jgi:hypothetical protein
MSCKTYNISDFSGKEFEYRPVGLFVSTLTFKNDSIFEFRDYNWMCSRGSWYLDKKRRKIIIKTINNDSLKNFKDNYTKNLCCGIIFFNEEVKIKNENSIKLRKDYYNYRK